MSCVVVTATYPADCWDYFDPNGEFASTWSGTYGIFPPISGKPTLMLASCDMETVTVNNKQYTGGWTVSIVCMYRPLNMSLL